MSDFKIEARDRQYHGFSGNEESWEGPYMFVVGTDPQYGMIDTMAGKKDIGWDQEVELTRKAIQAVNAMAPRPKFFVVCGDLVQCTPGEYLRDEQEADFIKEFSKLNSDIPLVLVSGNHDVGRIPDAASIACYTERFGDDYYSFWAGGVRFLVLNTQLYDNDSKAKEIRAQHDEWLLKELETMKTSGCKHAVVFQHIPWFLQKPDEEKVYFNIEKEFRLQMLEKFNDAGVKVVFSGHQHQNDGGFYKGLEQVVTSAMGWQQRAADTPGIRIVKVKEEGITHQYYEMDDIPTTIDLKE